MKPTKPDAVLGPDDLLQRPIPLEAHGGSSAIQRRTLSGRICLTNLMLCFDVMGAELVEDDPLTALVTGKLSLVGFINDDLALRSRTNHSG